MQSGMGGSFVPVAPTHRLIGARQDRIFSESAASPGESKCSWCHLHLNECLSKVALDSFGNVIPVGNPFISQILYFNCRCHYELFMYSI